MQLLTSLVAPDGQGESWLPWKNFGCRERSSQTGTCCWRSSCRSRRANTRNMCTTWRRSLCWTRTGGQAGDLLGPTHQSPALSLSRRASHTPQIVPKTLTGIYGGGGKSFQPVPGTSTEQSFDHLLLSLPLFNKCVSMVQIPKAQIFSEEKTGFLCISVAILKLRDPPASGS